MSLSNLVDYTAIEGYLNIWDAQVRGASVLLGIYCSPRYCLKLTLTVNLAPNTLELIFSKGVKARRDNKSVTKYILLVLANFVSSAHFGPEANMCFNEKETYFCG